MFRLYEKKLWAIIKIQSHVRKMIALRAYRKLKVTTDYKYDTHNYIFT